MGEIEGNANGNNEREGLMDVWRYENPEKREFTRRQLKEGNIKAE